jgi:hypothetical protein
MRGELAKPLGRLYDADDLEKRPFLRAIRIPKTVVSVGDRVTETLAAKGRVPDVQIVDGRENRREREPPDVPHARTIKVRNPPGTITQQAMNGVKKALEGKKPARVLVDGEEDMLAIPAVVFAPVSASVFYGQPGVGIVKIKVTVASKARNRKLLSRMPKARTLAQTANL